MTTLREAAQQALEACTDAVMGWQSLAPLSVRSAAMESLDVLRDALAQEEQEPVAWMYEGIRHDGTAHGPHLVWKTEYMDAMSANKGAKAVPLYTHPPQELTKEDIAQNLHSRLDAAKLLEERRQEITQPRREWQGLTTQEAMALTDTAPKGVFYGCDAGIGLGIWIAAVAAAERALKEKNNG